MKTIYIVVYCTKVEYLESSVEQFDSYEKAVERINIVWQDLLNEIKESEDIIHVNEKDDDGYYIYSENVHTLEDEYYECHIETLTI